MTVLIENLQRNVPVDTDRLAALAQHILDREQVEPEAELSIALLDPEGMRALNAKYRGVDEPTDVLSFAMRGGEPAPVDLLGDVLLCPEIAQQNAERIGHTLETELKALLEHGISSILGAARDEE